MALHGIGPSRGRGRAQPKSVKEGPNQSTRASSGRPGTSVAWHGQLYYHTRDLMPFQPAAENLLHRRKVLPSLRLCRTAVGLPHLGQSVSGLPKTNAMVRRTGKDGMPKTWRIPVTGGEPQRTGSSMAGMGSFSLHLDGRRIAFEYGERGRSPNKLWVLENIPGATVSKTAASAK